VEFDPAEWSEISDDVKDLIIKMLERDASKRITLPAVRMHPWFAKMKETDKQEGENNKEILNRLKNFRAPKRLQLEAMKFLANNLPNSS